MFNKKLKSLFLLGSIVLLLGTLIALTIISSYRNYCEELIPAKSEFGKSPVIAKNKISDGFTLFTSLNLSGVALKEGTIYLVDFYGRVVHSWKTRARTQYSILKPDGNLLVTQAQIADGNYPPAARITSIQEIDANSNVVWEYKNEALHHDFDSLPNGNIAVLEWVKLPESVNAMIRGGVPGTEFQGKYIFTDRILEIDRNKNIVWSWNASDHIDPNEYEIPAFFYREQWTHANSLRYVSKDPFFQKEAYLVSMRYLSTIFLISKESGEIIWKSPKGLFMHQHDATLLDNGNILAFNNGFHTSLSQNPFSYGSSVVEINPISNQVVWEFPGSKNPLDTARLTEVILSGAQRLPNGNTLITLGTSGRIIEVTPDKKIVWDFVNPYSDPTDQPFPSNYIFKSRKYFKDQIKWLNNFTSFDWGFLKYCY